MTRLLGVLSDRLLTAVAPRAEAHASCTERCGIVDYYRSGLCSLYRRTCCIDYYCHFYGCSRGYYVGSVC